MNNKKPITITLLALIIIAYAIPTIADIDVTVTPWSPSGFSDETPANNSVDVDTYPTMGITTNFTYPTYNITFYVYNHTADAYTNVMNYTNVTNDIFSFPLKPDVNDTEYHYYNWTYQWYAYVENYTGAESNTSSTYNYTTLDYNINGCAGMELIVFCVWIALFAMFFIAGLVKNSTILGMISGLLIIILAAFVIIQGVYVESGTRSTAINPTTTVEEKEYTELVAPSSSYAMVWGVVMALAGVYILYANAETRFGKRAYA